MLETRY